MFFNRFFRSFCTSWFWTPGILTVCRNKSADSDVGPKFISRFFSYSNTFPKWNSWPLRFAKCNKGLLLDFFIDLQLRERIEQFVLNWHRENKLSKQDRKNFPVITQPFSTYILAWCLPPVPPTLSWIYQDRWEELRPSFGQRGLIIHLYT